MLSPKPHQTHLHISTPSKSSSPNSSLASMKIKTQIHNLLFSHICRFVRSLSKLKSIFLQLCQETRVRYLQDSDVKRRKKKSKYRKKMLFGSFRLHYNWCSSSHVLPINYSSSPVSPALQDADTDTHLYYDSTWNSVLSTDGNDKCFEESNDDFKSVNSNWSGGIKEGAEFCGSDGSSQLSSYLEWLEEKGKNGSRNEEEEEEMNEIDKLADLFIANCHEKFRLEKIESYRRYQEMLARSM